MIALGGVIAYLSHRGWRQREGPTRCPSPLPPSALPWLLTVEVLPIAVPAGVVAVTGGGP